MVTEEQMNEKEINELENLFKNIVWNMRTLFDIAISNIKEDEKKTNCIK